MMTPERWQEAQDLFHQALDRPPEARAAFLHRACDDPALRAEVEALLAADAAPPSIFEAAQEQTRTLHPQDEAQPASPDQDRLRVASDLGRRIGPYRLVREIGRGGMGTVYLAERADVDTVVAIKLVRGALAAPETVERFLRERRLLARLKHPNIARLLDAGMTDEALPYFVMEYVEGEPITDYCDARQLTIQARFTLFQRVCQAVHYAHQNLIVHRDLKPPNILVTDDGAVKLLDFGIAKLMEDDDESEGLTRTGMRLMTPEYAAPEQVLGEAVTTATDVYALGVLLYELLTGHRPYDVRGLSMGEIERVIGEEEPMKPSVAASRYPALPQGRGSTALQTSEPIRAVRTRNAERLRRRLAGDLDVICLKALSKEPSRRYASAEQLAVDIERHLAGLPIEARPGTMGYRVRKFVRRHRVGVAATAVFALLLVGFAAATALQQTETARERDRAEALLARSEAVTEFLIGLFEASDPEVALGEEVTARELLQRGVARTEELEREPAVQAQMLDVVGRVYRNLSRFNKAQPLLEQALMVRREHLGEEHPDVARSLRDLAALHMNIGNYDAADSLLGEALALQRRRFGEAHEDVALSLNLLAGVRRHQGNYDAAEPLYRQALKTYEALGAEHRDWAGTLNELALLMRLKGAYAAAESLHWEALAMQRELLGVEHPYVATSLSNLATVLYHQNNTDAAEPMARQALAMRRRLFGAEHRRVATSLNLLALILQRKENYDAAEPFFRQALAMRRRLLGAEHPDVALSLKNLASLLHDQGDYDAAELLHQEALAMRRRLLGARHPDVALSLWNLASVLRDKGDFPEAERLFQEALTINREQFDETNIRVQMIYKGLAQLFEAWGKPGQAAVYRERLRETEAE